MTTTELAQRILALEAEATRARVERTRLQAIVERLSCRLELAEARLGTSRPRME